MSREVIAVDLDEVAFPFVENFIVHDKEHHGSDLRPQDFFCYAFEDVMNISLDEAVERVYHFNGADHDHIMPLEGSAGAIQRLGEKYDLVVVTARHPQFAGHTEQWLERRLPNAFSGVEFIGYAAVMGEAAKKKIDVCRELGAIALIDDSVGHVTECAEAGTPGVLFGDYPWNQAPGLHPLVTRCNDWPAVEEYFDARG